MKFLSDQDVYASTVRFLLGLGHDVSTARQLGLAQADDTELLLAGGGGEAVADVGCVLDVHAVGPAEGGVALGVLCGHFKLGLEADLHAGLVGSCRRSVRAEVQVGGGVRCGETGWSWW
jgi:hypothetical protein